MTTLLIRSYHNFGVTQINDVSTTLFFHDKYGVPPTRVKSTYHLPEHFFTGNLDPKTPPTTCYMEYFPVDKLATCMQSKIPQNMHMIKGGGEFWGPGCLTKKCSGRW